jgi:short-subunit dehydrogenase
MESQRQLAVISGGSRGLGFEVAQALGAQGFDLALIAKDKDRLDGAASKISNLFPGINVTIFPVDLADIPATRETANQISSQ